MTGSEQVTAVTDVTKAPPDVLAADCLVVIYRRSGPVGACIKLGSAPVRIGRGADNEIELDDEGVSRRHARLERMDQRLVLMDVGSTNGTLLNGTELRGTAELRNGDHVKIGSTIFKYLSATDLEAALHEQIYANSITDNLTQLFNKRHFEDALAREFSRSRRYHRPLSLLLIDIDFFKRVNDTYGHHVGDIALRATADAIRSSLRSEDFLARFGGEEIVALLAETTLEQAIVVAETVRKAVRESVVVFRDQRFSVTVSIGCAEFDPADVSTDRFIERCDAKVYEAKRAGRDRVCW